jgi:hypothetical protein
LSRIAAVASNLSPATQKLAFKLWLQAQTSPKEVFKALQLNQLRGTATKIDDNPAVLEWLRYTMAYNAQPGNR